MEKKTRVIFRVVTEQFCKGDIIAFFPDTRTAKHGGEIMSYSHYGQHGTATIPFYFANTRPAKENEYQELYNELTKIVGYNLQVIKRMNY